MNRSDLPARHDDFIPVFARGMDLVFVDARSWRQGGHGHDTIQQSLAGKAIGLSAPESLEPFLPLADLDERVDLAPVKNPKTLIICTSKLVRSST